MNRGRSRIAGGHSNPRGRGRGSRPVAESAAHHYNPVSATGHPNESSSGSRYKKSPSVEQTPWQGKRNSPSASPNNIPERESSWKVSKDDNPKLSEQIAPEGGQGHGWPQPIGEDGHSYRRSWQSKNVPKAGDSLKQTNSLYDIAHEKILPSLKEKIGYIGAQADTSAKGADDTNSLDLDQSFMKNITHLHDESDLPVESAAGNRHFYDKGLEQVQAFNGKACDHRSSHHSQSVPVAEQFDICPPKTGTAVVLKPSLLEKNRLKRNDIKRSMEGSKGTVLRAGMVLLKNYISSSEQVEIVKTCRKLGIGPGGFYQPGYRDGAKLHLKMMCLGLNWDPEESKYGELRPTDGAKPPCIPDEFKQLVKRAMETSHILIANECGAGKPDNILPFMSPDICIVNFYSANGRLGLHQDRDETQESLHRELPVVSFSIGDSSEFLYGDQREIDKADKVVLESGDVLIFGGKSRHIFHGTVLTSCGILKLIEPDVS
ncbi:hypothetical protein Nepgr_005660 [Nepenthes gracilis]|uniref:Alpha-ketoglutarate-dependent dioxygenase AlkB-like domain-containing protein n=1 Tax=Nepenthes gracilis TaxID=150966 RepID=A0AAD3S3R0_NEPGR|nr:hypothetical protein Nepgr_005660 [Nepenthes gracilis]